MAVDTRDKRASAGSLLGLETLPNPDGSITTAGDFQHVAGAYSGIAASSPGSMPAWTGEGWPFITWTYVESRWAKNAFYLEIALKATVGTCYARVYDKTADAEVSGSEVSTSSSTYAVATSSALTLTDGNEYYIQKGLAPGDAGSIKNGVLVNY